jgi:hypothetical protein
MSNIVKRDAIQVIGVGSEVSTHIVSLLTQSVTELILSPVSGVVEGFTVEYNVLSQRLSLIVSTTRNQFQVAAKTDAIFQFSNAIENINSNNNIRPEIKDMAIESFKEDLQNVLMDLTRQLKKKLAD